MLDGLAALGYGNGFANAIKLVALANFADIIGINLKASCLKPLFLALANSRKLAAQVDFFATNTFGFNCTSYRAAAKKLAGIHAGAALLDGFGGVV